MRTWFHALFVFVAAVAALFSSPVWSWQLNLLVVLGGVTGAIGLVRGLVSWVAGEHARAVISFLLIAAAAVSTSVLVQLMALPNDRKIFDLVLWGVVSATAAGIVLSDLRLAWSYKKVIQTEKAASVPAPAGSFPR